MTDYFKMAREGTLPPDFDQWELVANKHGDTVAHEAARHGNLPKGFDRWELADEDGWTVRDAYEQWRKDNA